MVITIPRGAQSNLLEVSESLWCFFRYQKTNKKWASYTHPGYIADLSYWSTLGIPKHPRPSPIIFFIPMDVYPNTKSQLHNFYLPNFSRFGNWDGKLNIIIIHFSFRQFSRKSNDETFKNKFKIHCFVDAF